MTLVRWKPILPKDPHFDLSELRKPVKETVKKFREKFGRFVMTWDVLPVFDEEIREEFKKIIGEYSSSNPILKYVVGGTRVRYATMTDDFDPKTAHRVLDSGPGRGGLLYVDTSQPRPGIVGRDTDKEIADQEREPFKHRALHALNQIRHKSGHAMP
jgi:hypothetical protein